MDAKDTKGFLEHIGQLGSFLTESKKAFLTDALKNVADLDLSKNKDALSLAQALVKASREGHSDSEHQKSLVDLATKNPDFYHSLSGNDQQHLQNIHAQNNNNLQRQAQHDNLQKQTQHFRPRLDERTRTMDARGR